MVCYVWYERDDVWCNESMRVWYKGKEKKKKEWD